jgi:hypothetical protein
MKIQLFLNYCLLAGLAASAAHTAEVPAALRTRAEISDFRATASYDETMSYLHKLEALSPYVKVTSFGTSEQGRPLPLVIVSREKAFTAARARRLAKPIVFIQSGIHAGEIDGKDASLMLLRELVLGQRAQVLEAMTLVLIPIYNVDGHERVSRYNRAQQIGPEEGMGFRTNARGLDLNRDHLKLESAEARAFVALVNEWRPHLHVDNHVSDGFDHQWVIGVAAAEAPQAPPSVDAWFRANLPPVADATRSAGFPVGPYLELISELNPAAGAITPPYRPRYSTGYFALRNRPSVLIETHSRKPFRTRVLGNHAWLAALLSQVARDPAALVTAVATAERLTIARGLAGAPPSDVALRYGPDRDDPKAPAGPADTIAIPFYQWTTGTSVATGGPLTTWQRGVPNETVVPWLHAPRVSASVSRPRGYVVLPGWPTIEARLRGQGLRLEPIKAASDAEVETMRLSHPVLGTAPYQGAIAVTSVTVRRQMETRHIPAGALWIGADQPDFEVAVHLLEPDAPDSLLAWGYLSAIFEHKEWIEAPDLEALVLEMMKDPKVAAEWRTALGDPAFASDPDARSEWWARRTPYWDETIGMMPIYRAMKPLPGR